MHGGLEGVLLVRAHGLGFICAWIFAQGVLLGVAIVVLLGVALGGGLDGQGVALLRRQ